ncbi:MAG: DtxR family iron (metal) dependent repressor [Planctomycetaceae bacterium]|nr:DtxR family iron (metal) dependent repressor [Planctomycetaceae bacterium]MBH58280.1 DtxR family iron (metal) dependent repressor [Planctomycetaceae bacterium]
MPSLTIENYVKTIYEICSRQQDKSAATGQLAQALGVLPGTVTSMMKTLSDSGLASYQPYEGVLLTPSGTALALRVLRRHRLIELFLVRTLDLSWDEVHEEAENMEHAVSDLLVDRIDSFLGSPDFDPHGDPIPKADGTVRQANGSLLNVMRIGDSVRVVRVLDQSSEFLKRLTEEGIEIGATIEVLATENDLFQLSVNAGPCCNLSSDLASRILVEQVVG